MLTEIIHLYCFMFPRILILTFGRVLLVLMWNSKGMTEVCASVQSKTLALFCFPEHNCSNWRRAALFVMKCSIFNMHDGLCYLRIMLYIARIRGGRFVHNSDAL
jgi:hypothetical protein